MRLIAYDGTLFADLNVAATFPPGLQAGPRISPIAIAREGMPPAHAGTIQQSRQLTATFVVKPTNPIEATLMTLLGALRPGDPDDRVMVAEITDGPQQGTEIECRMACGQWRQISQNEIAVDFFAADDRWLERIDTAIQTAQITGATGIPLYNRGGAPARPVYAVSVAAQRATSSATVGWKYRRQATLTNSGTETWYRRRVTVDLGDTSAWVTAGKALASGDDIRVRISGQPSSQELPRTLTNPNSKRTLLHTYVTVPAGESVTLDIIYGNPNAAAPAYTLSTRGRTKLTYAADDLEGYRGVVGSATVSSITVAPSPAWEVDRWKGGYFYIPSTGRGGRIASNTADTITFNRGLSSTPAAGAEFLIWMSGVFVDGGRVTSYASGVITDTGHTENWGTNQLKGGTVTFLGGTANPSTMTIASNTGTTFTVQGSFTVAPSVNDSYRIERYGVLQYLVNPAVKNTAHRGIWRINKYNTRGSNVWYGDVVPGGWLPWLMLANQDDFAQARYVDEGSGTVENFPILYARRAVRSDNTWSEEGQADGVLLHDPRGFVGMQWDYRMRNDNGVGQVVIMTQEPEGDDWQTIATDATTRATLTAVTSGGASGYRNFTGDTTPTRIYLGVLPADGVEIPSTAKKGDRVELRTNTYLRVYLDLADIGGLTNAIWSVGAEQSIYDLRATLRLGGGANADPPYDKIALDTLLNIAIPGQYLVTINTDPSAGQPLVGLYNDGGTLVERIPWAATITRHERDADGVDTALVSRALAPLPIGTNLLGASEDRITGWSFTPDPGITAALANEGTTVYDGDGEAFKMTISATPAGAWEMWVLGPQLTLIPGTLYEFGGAIKSTITGITVSVEAEWLANGVNSIADFSNTVAGVTIASTARWYPVGSGKRVHAGSPLTPPTDGVNVWLHIQGSGNVAGTVYFDQIVFGVPNLYVEEAEMGTLEVDARWREGWYG